MFAEYVDTKESIINELKTIESTFKPAITEALWDMDDEQLDKLTDGLSRLPSITRIDVLDKDNVVIISKQSVESRDDSFYHEFETVYKYENRDNLLGKVRLYSDYSNVLDRVELGFIIIIVNAFIKTIALCLLFLWAFKKYLTQPLSELTDEVKSIDLDNISKKRVKLSSDENNELTVLENSFNEMVTKIDKAKEELDQANKELEHKVKERTKKLTVALYDIKTQKESLQSTLEDLNKTQSQLIESEKMAALGQLIAGVAHEINTPLGAIKSSGTNITVSLDIVFDELPKLLSHLDESKKEQFFELVKLSSTKKDILTTREERKLRKEVQSRLDELGINNSRSISNIIVKMKIQNEIDEFIELIKDDNSDEILNIAYKIADVMINTSNINIAVDRANKIVFALKTFSRFSDDTQKVKTSLKESLDTVLTIYHNKIKQGTELVREYEDINDIYCYADELAQVWTNIIHNALQAMDHKGTLTVSLSDEEEHQKVSIKDTGCGIPDDIKDKIFDPFFTTKAAGEGSGLGLDIIKRIIDKHEGQILVNSEVGVGTEFIILLPKV
jgi:signal transduction histidine kinase